MDASRLKSFNKLVGARIEGFGTREDFGILLEIAASEQEGSCLTLKQLMLGVGIPESTLKRRLARLVRLRHVAKRMTANDHRVQCYSLPERTRQTLATLIAEIRAFDWGSAGGD